MARRKYNLLEVAIADLRQASFSLRYGTDELDIDMAAYHCSQCVEKVAKYLIKLQGDTCVPSHTTDMYLPDLKNEEARTLIEQIATKVDSWNNQIRYEHTQLASAKAVLEVVKVCEQLIKLAEKNTPEQIVEIEASADKIDYTKE